MIPSVSSEADREWSDGAVYYAQEGSAELGLAFIASSSALLASFASNPNLVRTGEVGAVYSIIYYIKGDELRVIALAHHRRKPGYWASRR